MTENVFLLKKLGKMKLVGSENDIQFSAILFQDFPQGEKNHKTNVPVYDEMFNITKKRKETGNE